MKLKLKDKLERNFSRDEPRATMLSTNPVPLERPNDSLVRHARAGMYMIVHLVVLKHPRQSLTCTPRSNSKRRFCFQYGPFSRHPARMENISVKIGELWHIAWVSNAILCILKFVQTLPGQLDGMFHDFFTFLMWKNCCFGMTTLENTACPPQSHCTLWKLSSEGHHHGCQVLLCLDEAYPLFRRLGRGKPTNHKTTKSCCHATALCGFRIWHFL